jgi:hypothetical protein
LAAFKNGDRIRILDRPANAGDLKSGLFYNHYRGLTGAVQKAFKSGEMAIEVDPDCLPESIWKRHMDVRDQMRQRWLEGLTDEARRKLTPDQKTFDLRYVVLVAAADVQKERQPRASR